MTVIYFTDGALIEDLTLRRSLLRIPEVIESLRNLNEEFVDCDLFLAMNEAIPFSDLNFHQKSYLKSKIQEALFKRWQKKGIRADLIIKRNDYCSFNAIADIFRKISTLDEIKVITIGPGFDEVEPFMRRLTQSLTQGLTQGQSAAMTTDTNSMGSQQKVHDVISLDPQLNWFWTDVRSNLELNS